MIVHPERHRLQKKKMVQMYPVLRQGDVIHAKGHFTLIPINTFG